DGVVLADEVKGAVLAAAALLGQALLAEVILVPAALPGHDGARSEVLAVGSQPGNDLGVGEAVVQHFIDALADFLGQAGDFALATARGTTRLRGGRSWIDG